MKKYHIERRSLSHQVLEDIGIMDIDELKAYCEAHYVNPNRGEYGAAFATEGDLLQALAFLEEAGWNNWLLGVNPETEEGEEVNVEEHQEPEE